MVSYSPISLTASATLSKGRHTGATIIINAAAGLTLTLPASTGGGAKFEIIVGTTVTSNNAIVKVANASDVMAGVAWGTADGGNTVNGWETLAASDTITMDGSTMGGLKGDKIILQDVALNVWAVSMWAQATGTEASPFSATV